MTRPDIVSRIKAMPVGQVLGHATSASLVLTSVWFYGGWAVKSYAQTAFEELLLKNQAFKDLQTQSAETGQSILGVGKKVDGLEDQLGDLLGQIKTQNGAVVRMEKQFDDLNRTLTQLLLQRRSSNDGIPPFPTGAAP